MQKMTTQREECRENNGRDVRGVELFILRVDGVFCRGSGDGRGRHDGRDGADESETD